MDILADFSFWTKWFADQLAWIAQLSPTYIGLAAILPLLITLVSRNLLATVGATLLALGTIALCVTQQVDWATLAILEGMAGFLLAVAAVIGRRKSRALRNELDVLNERIHELEAAEERRLLIKLSQPPQNSTAVTERIISEEDSPGISPTLSDRNDHATILTRPIRPDVQRG
jgi:hypothetical protein